MAVSILLSISAAIDGDRTVLNGFKILGPIPSSPAALAGFSPFINMVRSGALVVMSLALMYSQIEAN